MKLVSALLGLTFGLGLAACHHESSSKSTAPQTAAADPNDQMVDPTLPSWAPRSCRTYHTAVVQAVACDKLEPGTRDGIKTKYETTDAAWREMHDAPQGKIAEIDQSCTSEADAIRAQLVGKCDTGPGTTTTTATTATP